MTVIDHNEFMRFLGKLQLLLFKLRPAFYADSYLKELEYHEKREI